MTYDNSAVLSAVFFMLALSVFLGFETTGHYWVDGNGGEFVESDSQWFPQEKFLDEFDKAGEVWSSQGSYFSYADPLIDRYDTDPEPWIISDWDSKNGLYYVDLGYGAYGNPVLGETYPYPNTPPGEIETVDIALTSRVEWSDYGGDNTRVDIQSVAIHELGHGLGLDEEPEDLAFLCGTEEPVMRPNQSKSTKYRELRCDDIEGLEDIYQGGTDDEDDPPCTGCGCSAAATLSGISYEFRQDLDAALGTQYTITDIKTIVESSDRAAQSVNDLVVSHRALRRAGHDPTLSNTLLSDMESTLSVIEEESIEYEYDQPTIKRDESGASQEASGSLAGRLESIRTRLDGLEGMKLSEALDLLQKTPKQFTVQGNAPNPVSTTTSITYGLEEEAAVTVEVYDVTGRHVRTLVDERQRDGFHRVRFNAEDLASGTYVYRVQAGEQVETGKMTVVK